MAQSPGKTYHTEIEVRGYELDSFGHVNHANYLHYFEFARWRMLADEGITLKKFQEWDRFPVIAAIEIRYLKPTFMGDRLTVETSLIEYRRSSMHHQQTISKNGVEVASAKVRSVIVTGAGRPAELPEMMANRWREVAAGESPTESSTGATNE